MDAQDYHELQRKTLWRVEQFACPERVEPNDHYWLSNFQRNTTEESVVFQLTVMGRILYKDAAGTQEVLPGSLILFTANEASEYGRPPEWRETYVCEYVNLRGPGLAAHWNLIRARHGSVLSLGLAHPLRHAMLGICEFTKTHPPAERLASAAHGFVLDLMRHLDASEAEAQSPVERAVDELLRQPAAQGGLKQVARRHGCSREHLARVFRERVGQSPAKYLAEARARKALDLLRATHLTVDQVAVQTGFGSKHTLARRIKAVTGQPPSEARMAQDDAETADNGSNEQ